MAADQLTPAAQYLRMSTEHQQYSIENQAAAIQRYAEFNGFEVVKTYADPARSGVVLKRRTGLQELLRDVCSEDAPLYRVILVYDVSRWGRFQDTDEAAHYEFLCKAAGVPVHYCSETFAYDGTLPNMIMKALKRTMAGEYSRELSKKVFDGQKRIAKLGFKQGGRPGYGLRRMLVSRDRSPKQQLVGRERKSLATDRVTLVPGPTNEVRVVRNIYKMLISGFSIHGIATELNRRNVEYAPGSKWDSAAVYGILTGLKYIGFYVYGRTSSKLYTPTIKHPATEWVITAGAFEPLVDYASFAQAQQILYYRSQKKSEEEMLYGLKQLLRRYGRLSGSLIACAHCIPSPTTYRARFGSLQRAYKLIGYGGAESFGPLEVRRKTHALRDELTAKLAEMFPEELSTFRRGGKWKPQLQLNTGELVSVLIVRSVNHGKGTL